MDFLKLLGDYDPGSKVKYSWTAVATDTGLRHLLLVTQRIKIVTDDKKMFSRLEERKERLR